MRKAREYLSSAENAANEFAGLRAENQEMKAELQQLQDSNMSMYRDIEGLQSARAESDRFVGKARSELEQLRERVVCTTVVNPSWLSSLSRLAFRH